MAANGVGFVSSFLVLAAGRDLVTLRCLAFEQDQYTRDDAKHSQASGDR
jgi:hypothetical protein